MRSGKDGHRDRKALRKAFDALGRPPDECRVCHGTGKKVGGEIWTRQFPCQECHGTGKKPIEGKP